MRDRSSVRTASDATREQRARAHQRRRSHDAGHTMSGPVRHRLPQRRMTLVMCRWWQSSLPGPGAFWHTENIRKNGASEAGRDPERRPRRADEMDKQGVLT
jgi:hypothetical protein